MRVSLLLPHPHGLPLLPVQSHMEIAVRLNKPLVIEEFGLTWR